MFRSFVPIVAALLLPGAAGAAVLSERFEFTITGFEGPAFSGRPAIGDRIGATFSFDTEATAFIRGGYNTGVLDIDGYGTTTSNYGTIFANNLGSDAGCCFDRVSFRGTLPSTLSLARVQLIDRDGEVLSGPGVPDTFDFDLIDIASLSVGLFEGEARLKARYTRPEPPIDSPDMPAVPLPASLPLLLAGLGALGLRRR